MLIPSRERARQFIQKYVVPFSILLGSRVVVACAIIFSSHFVGRSPGNFPEFSSRWYRSLLHWDAGWYLKIATEGYSYDGNDLIQQSVTFYPLYPLLGKAIAFTLQISHAAALVLVSNVAFVVAVGLFFRSSEETNGAATAIFATATLCFFPTSFFFSAAYTESFALLLLISFFLLLKRQRYLPAAVIAGLATATRPTGIVLMLPLLIELGPFIKERRRLLTVCATIAMSVSGLLLYALYLHVRFGNAFAFSTNSRAWIDSGGVQGEIFRALTLRPFARLADVWNIGPDPNTLSPWFFVAFLALLIIYRKSLTVSHLVFSLGVLLLPYVSLSGGIGFRSFTRYAMLAFPVFLIAGDRFARRPWFALTVVGIFAALLFMYTAFFTQWYFAG